MIYCKVVCIIVDAYSTGKNIAPIIKAQGYPCIHIKSSNSLPSRYQHNESDFILSLTYTGSIESIIERLTPYKVRLCIPGYESGVELADLLCEFLSLQGNDRHHSLMRRNKYIMNEAVASAGLKTVRHCQSDSLSTLINWVKDVNHYPIVAKPFDSANGDGVFFCDNDAELENAFNSIINTANQFGVKNKQVLVESLNRGNEYIINTVSWERNHFVAEIWRVTRRLYTTIYDKAEIVTMDEEEWQPLIDYTFQVLDALHIHYGAATTEVKYTKDTGATLLETSARLMGNSPVAFSHQLAGYTQLSLLIEAYLFNADFMERFKRKKMPSKLHGMIVVLISEKEGIIHRKFREVFHHLKTLHSYNIEDEPGTTICKTTNSLTAPGEIYLMGSKEAIEKDYLEIRRIESTLYQEATKSVLGSLTHNAFLSKVENSSSELSQELDETLI